MSANSSFSDESAGLHYCSQTDDDTYSESSLIIEPPICEHFTRLCDRHEDPFELTTYEQIQACFNRRVAFLSKKLTSGEIYKASYKFFEATKNDRIEGENSIKEYTITPFSMTFRINNTVELEVPRERCRDCKEVFALHVEDVEDFIKTFVYCLDIEVKDDGARSFRNFANVVSPKFFENVVSSCFVFRDMFPTSVIKKISTKCPKMSCMRAWHQPESHQEVDIGDCVSKMHKIEHLEFHYPDRGNNGYGYRMGRQFFETLIRSENNALRRPLRNVTAYRTKYTCDPEDILRCTGHLGLSPSNNYLLNCQDFIDMLQHGYDYSKDAIVRFKLPGLESQMGPAWKETVVRYTPLNRFRINRAGKPSTWYSSTGAMFLFDEE